MKKALIVNCSLNYQDVLNYFIGENDKKVKALIND
jgi:hypothetical protein